MNRSYTCIVPLDDWDWFGEVMYVNLTEPDKDYFIESGINAFHVHVVSDEQTYFRILRRCENTKVRIFDGDVYDYGDPRSFKDDLEEVVKEKPEHIAAFIATVFGVLTLIEGFGLAYLALR